MEKIMKKFALIIGTLSLSAFAFAQDMPPGPPPSSDPAVRAAFKECAEQATKDQNGRPNRMQMDACLKAKGIQPPMHKHLHPEHENQGQPKMN